MKFHPFGNRPIAELNRHTARVLLYDYEICIHNIIPRNKSGADSPAIRVAKTNAYECTGWRWWLTIVL